MSENTENELLRRLAAMSPLELESRRRQIVDSCKGDYNNLTQSDLEEMAFITSTLRRRNAKPPKSDKERKVRPKPTLESILDI